MLGHFSKACSTILYIFSFLRLFCLFCSPLPLPLTFFQHSLILLDRVPHSFGREGTSSCVLVSFPMISGNFLRAMWVSPLPASASVACFVSPFLFVSLHFRADCKFRSAFPPKPSMMVRSPFLSPVFSTGVVCFPSAVPSLLTPHAPNDVVAVGGFLIFSRSVKSPRAYSPLGFKIRLPGLFTLVRLRPS